MLAAVNESLKETVMKEGTWLMPKGVKLKGLKKLLTKPLLLGKNGDNASEAIGNFIGDDRLMDDLYDAGKSDPKGDARPYIKAAMLRLGINVRRLGFKEDTILDRIANKIQERKNG
jgi:hypothetical protein